MKRVPLLSLLAAFTLLLFSCKNGNKSGLSVPKDAAFVFHIDASSLSSKLSWDEIKKTTWFQELRVKAQEEDSLAQKILDNPEASGLDVKSDFVFFTKKRGRGGFSVFEGSVKDAKAFEALVKKISRQEKAEKDGDWNIITADNSTVVTWNDSKFAVINDMPFGDFNPMSPKGGGESTRFGSDSLKIFVKQVMNLDNDESLFDDDRFASIMKEKADMHMWVNAGSLYSDMAGMMSMMKISTLFEGNVSAATINFEDGKIAMKAKQYFGKEMEKAMEKWKFKNIDASVLNRIPSENVIGVLALNMDPQGIKEFMKTMGLDGMANMFLSKQGFTLDEILSATKGEFVVAVSDLQMKDTTISFPTDDGAKPFTFTTSRPDFNVLFATTVNQKSSFDKLLNVFQEDSAKLPFTYQLNNEWFVAGNKPASINAFVAGNQTKHAFTEKISGNPFGMYIDIQRLLKTIFTKDSTVNSYQAEAANVWKDLVAVGKEFKDGVATSEFVINMVDSKTNSLKQINQFIEKMNSIKKTNKVAFEKDMEMNDDSFSTAVPPPPVVDEEKKQ